LKKTHNKKDFEIWKKGQGNKKEQLGH